MPRFYPLLVEARTPSALLELTFHLVHLPRRGSLDCTGSGNLQVAELLASSEHCVTETLPNLYFEVLILVRWPHVAVDTDSSEETAVKWSIVPICCFRSLKTF